MIETMLRCREDDPKRNNVFSLYDIYGHVLAQEYPFLGGNEIYNMDRLFFRPDYYAISLFELMLQKRKEDFKEIHSFS